MMAFDELKFNQEMRRNGELDKGPNDMKCGKILCTNMSTFANVRMCLFRRR